MLKFMHFSLLYKYYHLIMNWQTMKFAQSSHSHSPKTLIQHCACLYCNACIVAMARACMEVNFISLQMCKI